MLISIENRNTFKNNKETTIRKMKPQANTA